MNESHDISADLYQWFNKYCCDILNVEGNNIGDLKFDLEEANMNVLVDEAADSLVADFGWNSDSIYEYRDEIEYDLEKLISDALDYIEHGDTSWVSFEPNKADWMDRYRDNDEYTASLESHNKVGKMNKKLEARIRRLEKLLSTDNKSKKVKNESFNMGALEKAVKGLTMTDRALGVFCDSSDTPDVDRVDNLRDQIEDILDELTDMLAFGE